MFYIRYHKEDLHYRHAVCPHFPQYTLGSRHWCWRCGAGRHSRGACGRQGSCWCTCASPLTPLNNVWDTVPVVEANSARRYDIDGTIQPHIACHGSNSSTNMATVVSLTSLPVFYLPFMFFLSERASSYHRTKVMRLKTTTIKIEQSQLTGESQSVTKEVIPLPDTEGKSWVIQDCHGLERTAWVVVGKDDLRKQSGDVKTVLVFCCDFCFCMLLFILAIATSQSLQHGLACGNMFGKCIVHLYTIKSSVSTAVASCSGSVPCYLFVPLQKFGISDSNRLYDIDINYDSYFSCIFCTTVSALHCYIFYLDSLSWNHNCQWNCKTQNGILSFHIYRI